MEEVRVSETAADSTQSRLLLSTAAATSDRQEGGGSVAEAARSSPSSGFVNVAAVSTAAQSPDFDRRRVEAEVEVRVGELRLLVDVASAYRIGAFLLFELLPATQRPSTVADPTASGTRGRSSFSLTPLTPSRKIAASPAASALSAVSVPLPRSHQTRLSVRATFDCLRLSLSVADEAVTEVEVRGVGADYVDFLHARDIRAQLRSIAVRDCTPLGSLYPDVVRSAPLPTSDSDSLQPSPPLISLSYQTFSPLDASAPSHAAALTGRLRGLHFVFLRRFVDEQLALLLTGPVARLLKEKKARDEREERQRRERETATVHRPSVADLPSGVRSLPERRRSSLASALLPSPSSQWDGEVEEAALSPFSGRRLLLVDLALEDVGLVVPHHSASPHFVAASFASIAATNRPVEGAQSSEVEMAVAFSAFSVRSSLLVGQERREATVVDLSALQLSIASDEAQRSVHVRVAPSDAVLSLTPASLQLLLSLPTSNLKEEGGLVRRALKAQATQLPPLPVRRADEVPVSSPQSRPSAKAAAAAFPVSSLEASAASPSSPPSNSPSAMTFVVSSHLPTIRLELYADEGPPYYTEKAVKTGKRSRKQTDGEEEAEEERRRRWLLSLAIRGVEASFAVHPDGRQQAEVSVAAVQAVDQSREGQHFDGRRVLEQRKRLLVIGAVAASQSSPSPPPPLRLTFLRSVDPVQRSGALSGGGRPGPLPLLRGRGPPPPR